MVVGAHAEMRPSRNAEGQGKTQEHLRPRSEGGGGHDGMLCFALRAQCERTRCCCCSLASFVPEPFSSRMGVI